MAIPEVPSGYTERKYELLAPLGRGGGGVVVLGRKRGGTGERLVAVKKMKADSSLRAQRNEILILTQFLGTRLNIARHLDSYIEHDGTPHGRHVLVTQYYAGGTLNRITKYYSKPSVTGGGPPSFNLASYSSSSSLSSSSSSSSSSRRIPEAFIWHTAYHLAKAVTYLHSMGLVHRDIKPPNVFLKWDPGRARHLCYPRIVLGDFGITMQETDPHFQTRNPVGTAVWQGPELPLSGRPMDVWAIGAVVHALCHDGDPPVLPPPRDSRGCDFDFVSRWYADASKRALRPIAPRGYSKKLQDWMREMCRWAPEQRIEAAALEDGIRRVAHWQRARNFVPLHREVRSDIGPEDLMPR